MEKIDDTKWWFNFLENKEIRDRLPHGTINREELLVYHVNEENRFFHRHGLGEFFEIKDGCGLIKEIIDRVKFLKAGRRIKKIMNETNSSNK
jgi:hypothetical protein